MPFRRKRSTTTAISLEKESSQLSQEKKLLLNPSLPEHVLRVDLHSRFARIRARLVRHNVKRLWLILWILVLTATAAAAVPVIVVVRHAEKASAGGNDPELSVAGQKRAYSERFTDYGRIRYRVQAHAANCGADGESGAP